MRRFFLTAGTIFLEMLSVEAQQKDQYRTANNTNKEQVPAAVKERSNDFFFPSIVIVAVQTYETLFAGGMGLPMKTKTMTRI